MNRTTFNESLAASNVPEQASPYLKALWYDAKGNWEKAHELIQDLPDENASWLHAYLHRKEGDTRNADWWYRKAGKQRPQLSLQQEWEQLVTAFL